MAVAEAGLAVRAGLERDSQVDFRRSQHYRLGKLWEARVAEIQAVRLESMVVVGGADYSSKEYWSKVPLFSLRQHSVLVNQLASTYQQFQLLHIEPQCQIPVVGQDQPQGFLAVEGTLVGHAWSR